VSTYRHHDSLPRRFTASLPHFPLGCALCHAGIFGDAERPEAGWRWERVKRGQSGKCRIARPWPHACMTMTCVDATTSSHRTASIPPCLRPLADPTSPVARNGGNGLVGNVRMYPRPNEKRAASSGHAVYTGRRGVGGAAEKATTGNAWPQPREREERGPNCKGPLGACVVHAASHEASCADSGQAAAPADTNGVRL
jgi:hypothetical protein